MDLPLTKMGPVHITIRALVHIGGLSTCWSKSKTEQDSALPTVQRLTIMLFWSMLILVESQQDHIEGPLWVHSTLMIKLRHLSCAVHVPKVWIVIEAKGWFKENKWRGNFVCHVSCHIVPVPFHVYRLEILYCAQTRPNFPVLCQKVIEEW